MEREVDELRNFFITNGPLIVAVVAYVVVGGAVVSAVAWDLHRWYRQRDWKVLRFWFQKVRELMPRGIKGTNDDHAKHAVSIACYEAIFALAAEGKITWKKQEYYAQLLSIAFDSETLRKEKTHKNAMRNKIEKNILSVKAGPVHPLPGDSPPAVASGRKLSYLKGKAA